MIGGIFLDSTMIDLGGVTECAAPHRAGRFVLDMGSTKMPLLRSFTMVCLLKPRLPIFRERAVPDYWLVDRKGVVRELDARHDLERKIQFLLAESQ